MSVIGPRPQLVRDIRDDILKQFWNKLQELNDTFVQTNIAAMRDSSVAGNSIGIFESVILDIVRYYDTNEFDLAAVSYQCKLQLFCLEI